MNSENKQVGWMFLVWWIVLTSVGGFTGSFLSSLIGWGTQDISGDTGTLFFMLDNGVLALAVCAAQWILLRNHFRKSFWWLAAGALGRFFGVLVGYMVLVTIIIQFNLPSSIWQFYLFSTLRGITLGISQWVFLRQQRVKTGWWILASAVGWTIGLILIDTSQNEFLRNGVDYALAGIITGAVMIWILRQPVPEPKGTEIEGGFVRRLIIVWALSWGVSWFIGWITVSYIGWGLSFTMGGEIGGRLAGGIAGLIGGIGTALALKWASSSGGLKTYQMVLLAVGWIIFVFYDWADGFMVASLPGDDIQEGIGGPMSGLIGGVLTAMILAWVNNSINLKNFLLTAGGWALGFTVGGLLAWNAGFEIGLRYATPGNYSGNMSSLILLILISIICGAFAGWVGGTATSMQLPAPPLDTSTMMLQSEE